MCEFKMNDQETLSITLRCYLLNIEEELTIKPELQMCTWRSSPCLNYMCCSAISYYLQAGLWGLECSANIINRCTACLDLYRLLAQKVHCCHVTLHRVSIKNRGRLRGKQVHSCWRRGKTTRLLSGHWVRKMSACYQKRKASLTPTASRESCKDTANLHSQGTRCLGQCAQTGTFWHQA